MDRIILVGSEDVLSGGRMARDAGAEMSRAASTIQSAVEMGQKSIEDFIARFEVAVEMFVAAVDRMR